MSKRTHAEALQTKKSILAAAQKIFTERGFAKASLSDIAREANVTRGAIYWHFENKSELLAALMEEEATKVNIYNTLRQAVEENQRDPLGLLKKWALSHLTDEAASLFTSTLAATIEHAMISGVKSDVREKIIEMMQERFFVVSEALRLAVVQKQLPVDLDVDAAANFLCALVSGMIDHYRLGLMKHQLTYYRNVIEVAFAHLGDLKKPQRSF